MGPDSGASGEVRARLRREHNVRAAWGLPAIKCCCLRAAARREKQVLEIRGAKTMRLPEGEGGQEPSCGIGRGEGGRMEDLEVRTEWLGSRGACGPPPALGLKHREPGQGLVHKRTKMAPSGTR